MASFMAKTEIPLTSKVVAQQTYQEYVANPIRFIRRMVSQLEQDSPRYLDGKLAGAVTIALQEHSDSAQKILGGNFFRYACTDRQMRQHGKQLPVLATSSPRTLDEIKRLTDGSLKADSTIDVVTRQRAMRIERDDPEIGVIIQQLIKQSSTNYRIGNVEAFVEGVHNTHLNLTFFDTDATLPEPALITLNPSPLPVVNRSVVRAGLLETIFNSDGFVMETIDEVNKLTPGMVNRILRAAPHAPYPESYLLLASFEIFCFIREFQQRNRPFPVILEQDQIKHPDPEIARLMKAEDDRERLAKLGLVSAGDDSGRLSDLLIKYRNSILDEIEKTSPHLSWGICKLLYPFTINPDQLLSAIEGVVNQYSTLKTASRLYSHN